MKSLSWLLAQRYLPFKTGGHSIRTMAIITFISMTTGAFSLALVTAIMNGFQHSVHQKMQSIHPDATIYAYHDPIRYDKIKSFIEQQFPQVLALSPYALSHVMLHAESFDDELPKVAIIKAFDPDSEQRVSSLKSTITAGSWPQLIESGNYVLMGTALAETIGVTAGDMVTILYMDQPKNKTRKIKVYQEKARVTALFSTGIDEFDNNTVYASFNFFNKMFPEQGITQIGMKLSDKSTNLIRAIQHKIGLSVLTWQDLYVPLVSALLLEKYAMIFILLLITIVASMNIIALLFMIITHKKVDIAILKAMGVSNAIISKSFILLGCIIAAMASLIGIIMAMIASWVLEHYPFIKLPDAYYVSHLPAKMDPIIPVVVFMVIMIITSIASWFSTRRISHIQIAHVLRYEG